MSKCEVYQQGEGDKKKQKQTNKLWGHYCSRTIYKCEWRVVQLYLNLCVRNQICECVKESLVCIQI